MDRERRRHIVCVQIERVGTSRREDTVDAAHLRLDEGREELVRRLRDEQQVAVLLGRSLEPHGDVGRWGEVRRIDLLLRAERALDRPADVQAAAEADGVPWQPALEHLVLHELCDVRRAAHADRQPDQRRHRIVADCRLPLVTRRHLELRLGELRAKLAVALHHLDVLDALLEGLARPRDEEGVADVLVGEAAAVVYRVVHDVAD
mmetsp:Transcript_10780/g.27977  ORF Transcript_10780/g.27977 Transcript_10780/m.27977 type:complete len:205 (+) Transcript_10780:536-1150(+)